MKNLFVLFVLLFSLNSFADFNGSFKGNGKVFMNNEHVADCESLEFNLYQSSNAFGMTKGQANCAGEVIDYDAFELSVENGRLIIEGIDLGTISEKEVNIQFDSQNDEGQNEKVTIKFSRSNNGVKFYQEVKSEATKFVIEGSLK